MTEDKGLPARRAPVLAGGRVGPVPRAGLAGAAAALGHVPLGASFGALVGLGAGLALVALAPGVRAAAWRGWAFGAGYFLVSVAWVVEPFLVDLARHGWMAPFALILMPSGLALFWGGAGALSALAGPRFWPRVLALIGALTLMEWVRSWIFTGFPWGLPAYLWIDTGLAQTLAWIGPFGLTLLVLAISLGWAFWWARGGGLAPALASLVVVAGAAFGLDRLPSPPPGPGAPLIRVVQSGAPQDIKWQAEWVPVFWRRHLDGTAAEGGADLTLWSEVALPYLVEDAGDILPEISRAARGAPVIVGAQRREAGEWRNSMVYIGAEGQVAEVYDKVHLVPFGEYLPFDALLTRLGLNGIAANAGSGFRPGPGRAPFSVPGIGLVLPLICYEAIFPAEVRAGPRPRLIVISTNDSWFGTWAGPQQHLAQARARAIELGVPVARSAQTGISAIIDARGGLVAVIPLGDHGHADAPLPAILPPTIYARTGDLPALLASLLLLGGAIASGRARGRSVAQ